MLPLAKGRMVAAQRCEVSVEQSKELLTSTPPLTEPDDRHHDRNRAHHPANLDEQRGVHGVLLLNHDVQEDEECAEWYPPDEEVEDSLNLRGHGISPLLSHQGLCRSLEVQRLAAQHVALLLVASVVVLLVVAERLGRRACMSSDHDCSRNFAPSLTAANWRQLTLLAHRRHRHHLPLEERPSRAPLKAATKMTKMGLFVARIDVLRETCSSMASPLASVTAIAEREAERVRGGREDGWLATPPQAHVDEGGGLAASSLFRPCHLPLSIIDADAAANLIGHR